MTVTSAPPADYRQRGTADAAAILSVVFGVLAIGMGGFFSWALIFAILGLIGGVWGVRSRFRTAAIIGLICCLLGVTVGSVRLAYDTFILIYGDPPVLTEPADGEDDFILDSMDSSEPFE